VDAGRCGAPEPAGPVDSLSPLGAPDPLGPPDPLGSGQFLARYTCMVSAPKTASRAAASPSTRPI
jgi:hypothetical protein